ncbi:hypothetical protein H6P81_005741 [Aristolochia fimbriata]|uniref:Uncharacterized protein n=1 Tax=Aristolochia fimbriata TaxID=158543 RepID=A0AAV7EZ56_ARIFI|nr:hypothetical protein H6P81_005741 [Aristolochia fimbriata]
MARTTSGPSPVIPALMVVVLGLIIAAPLLLDAVSMLFTAQESSFPIMAVVPLLLLLVIHLLSMFLPSIQMFSGGTSQRSSSGFDGDATGTRPPSKLVASSPDLHPILPGGTYRNGRHQWAVAIDPLLTRRPRGIGYMGADAAEQRLFSFRRAGDYLLLRLPRPGNDASAGVFRQRVHNPSPVAVARGVLGGKDARGASHTGAAHSRPR